MKKTLLILAAIFTFFLVLVLAAGYFVTKMVGNQPVSSNSILTVTLSQGLRERANPLALQQTMSFDSMLSAMKRAANDKKIKAVLVYGDRVPLMLAQKEEIRNTLSYIVEKGKKVYVYFDAAGIGEYFIVPAGAEVISHNTPGGYFYFKGYYSAQLFMRRLLEEKLGIKMNVIHIGDYKGSGETYSRDTMSDYLREELTQFIDDLWSNLVISIPETRGINQKEFEDKLYSGKYFDMSPEEAKEEKFVDSFKNKFDLEDQFDSVITIGQYALQNPLSSFSKSPIALIVAEGEIVTGSEVFSPFSNKQLVAADTTCRLIRQAAGDPSVKSIVFRINSPGGSPLASELIYRELIKASQKKPVVASIGGMGASGGYYIACGCDVILADNCSLVGSIGVVSIIPEFTKLFDNIGVNVETVQKGKYSSFITPYEELTKDNREVLTNSMNDVYEVFKDRVGKSRGMTAEQVETIAKGRIYSGRRGHELGLVDKVGGLEEALALAAEKAGLSSVSYRRIEQRFSIFNYINRGAAIKMDIEELLPYKNMNSPALLAPSVALVDGDVLN